MAIIHRFFTVSGLTAVSRILGVAREALVSHILGASASMDALLIAYKFPNFFKKFFADGGFQSIFVPYYTDFVAINKNKGAGYFVSRVFTITFYVSLVLTTIVVIFAEEFVLLMASGFADDPDKLSLSADLTRIVFPSVVFIAACSVCSGLLIARKKFFFFAFQPILSNSVLIGILLMCDDVVPTVHYVATGYLIATISQFIYLYVCLKGLRIVAPVLSPIKIRVTPRLREFFKKLIPVLTGAGVGQINVFIDSLFGSFLPTGGISHIYFADRFVHLPLALFGISVGTILIPEIAAKIAQKADTQEITTNSMFFALRLTVPSAVGLISLSYLLISVLYGHGHFVESSVLRTADIVKIFAIGLPAYATSKIVSSVLFASKNSRVPAIAGISSVVSNIILNAILINYLQDLGLAAATAISGFINAYVMLKMSKIKLFATKRAFADFVKIIVASIAMFAVMYTLDTSLHFGYSRTVNEVLSIVIELFAGIVVYALSLVLLRDGAARNILQMIKNKK